jgi:tRNA(fMet)-specific endonuclease VapC
MEREIVCLDTSILIDFFRKKIKETTAFYKLSERNYSFSITAITSFEIYRGVTSAQKLFWDSLFEEIDVIPFDEPASKIAANLLQKLTMQNKQIALPDLFIAATAIHKNLKLVTLNKKDFEKIEDLDLLSDF